MTAMASESSGENRKHDVSGAQKSDDTLEGGFVRPLEDYFVNEKHRADTARRLAYSLVVILGSTVVLHYITVLILELKGRTDAVEGLGRIFNVWLPVIASLVSSAVTYYFTREK
jgi:hypothetical protein